MTTWYVDYEGGTDANASAGAGDSFSTRRKKLDNLVAAALNPGDTVRVMASPAPTLVGNATWTDGPLSGTITSVTCTSATPIVCTKAGHGLVTGDTVLCTAMTNVTAAMGVWKVGSVAGNDFTLLNADGSNSVGGGGSSGTGGTFRKFTNCVVELAAAVTKNIAECGNRGVKPNWTASTNVTCAKSTTDYKEGGECQSVAVAAAFTTGLAAYAATGTLDLSAYQQVSFWIKQTAGTLGAASSISLKLCSDTAGATPVNTINIPALGALNQWSPITVDTGGALGAAIKSIAFYVNTDNAAQTFLIDNVIACKASSSADSLNLTSLVSKNSGTEAWFGIQSINGTRVVLDATTNTVPITSPQRGYAGATETVSTYKRETIKTAMAASGADAQLIQDSGTAGSLISFSGGWNRTDMSTQTGETWFDGQNGFGNGVSSNGTKSYVGVDKINFTRYNTGLNLSSSASNDWSIGSIKFCNTSGSPLNATGNRLFIDTISAVCCAGSVAPGLFATVNTVERADSMAGSVGYTQSDATWVGTIIQANNNGSNGVSGGRAAYIGAISAANKNAGAGYLASSFTTCGSAICVGNTTYGINFSAAFDAKVLGGSTSGNASGGVTVTNGKGFLRNFTINEATEVGGITANTDGRVYSEKHDGTTGNVQVFCDGGQIQLQSSVVHGSASAAWKFSPTTTNRSQYYPLNQPIAQVAVAANSLVTISAWFQRDNTGLTGTLVCKGGQLAGVSSDVTAAMTAGANTWEQLTITFTPTEAGVIEIEAQFYGGTAYNGYVCDMSISQA